MNNLEDLTPSFELCSKIPAGCFSDSALVWRGRVKPAWDKGVYPRECGYCQELDPGDILAPAPTFRELLDALARMDTCPHVSLVVPITNRIVYTIVTGVLELDQGKKAEDLALSIWLKLKGENK